MWRAVGVLAAGWALFVVLIVVSQSWAFNVACTAYIAGFTLLSYVTWLYWTFAIRPDLRRPGNRSTSVPDGERGVTTTQRPPGANDL